MYEKVCDTTNCGEKKLCWMKFCDKETQMATKLKNSNCGKTQKLKFWPTFKNSNCDKTQIVTKLKNSNCDKTQKLKLWQY